ncbi:MAG: hypothetical protein UX99_C0020G0002 [Candidatus Amesbacteria bacterium GW2011_GWB1_47_26]|uniref:Uncharacterized protein n=1 Tax=Candidatus Amesbacteria bacterium GW2011_GWC2_45_19 TaxID=1618366 RepID=A0A0G1Q2H4_9BACT|nr:MAG: hypothetical protein UX05_C0006G0038 [Candidatus Amesbacteria bacterium GW2011_GWC2_45_19]KKU37231.1 MAG: hypothetical protein UX52_C0032G0002 [Candidatus Amesbacteria bacterium GW2011_GWA1_46_35]KKU68248.1 MAG: hypothetical protein UX93_C0009G0022 [Microgenomates group bacterium GW2011_GWC1_47_20]KKU74233.1 MAG: hypothetical protein UX99_C0020G0002 [Candidatus Amesbacteria bacterium GW2011_GWB1_47_26]
MNYNAGGIILLVMAVKKKDDLLEGQLDAKEEKTLDWILNAVVIFVLGWLALGILLSIGGLFNLWG